MKLNTMFGPKTAMKPLIAAILFIFAVRGDAIAAESAPRVRIEFPSKGPYLKPQELDSIPDSAHFGRTILLTEEMIAAGPLALAKSVLDEKHSFIQHFLHSATIWRPTAERSFVKIARHRLVSRKQRPEGPAFLRLAVDGDLIIFEGVE